MSVSLPEMSEIEESSARSAHDLPDAYKKASYIFLGLLIAYVLIRGVAGAAAKPFWIDELCTLEVVSQSGIREMCSALKRGVDSAPPLFYLIEAAALKVTRNREVALRLPAILAFPLTLACVFAYVKKRNGELIACVCAFLFLSTSVFGTYLSEARPYSLLMACMAFALVCYQRLPSRVWAVLFAVSLVCAGALHYYAVFLMIPFWVAEGVWLLGARQIRWSVWGALFFGLLPLVVFWPLLAGYRAYYGSSHVVFAHPSLSQVTDFYGSYFLTDAGFGLGLAVASLAIVAWTISRRGSPAPVTTRSAASERAETTLLAGLTCLPLIVFVMVRLTHGILTARYALPATIGIVASLAIAFSFTPRKIVGVFFLFVLSTVGLREYSFWRTGHQPTTDQWSAASMEQIAQVQNFVQSGGHEELPVVFDQEVLYPQMVYYCPRNWTRRLVYLLDEEREVKAEKVDTMVRLMKVYDGFLPVQLVDYTTFTRGHADFLLYAEPQGWMLAALRDEAVSVVRLRAEGPRTLYLIKMTEGRVSP